MTFAMNATDPDLDELRYQASDLPPKALFDTTTGKFTWNPTNSEAGEYTPPLSQLSIARALPPQNG